MIVVVWLILIVLVCIFNYGAHKKEKEIYENEDTNI